MVFIPTKYIFNAIRSLFLALITHSVHAMSKRKLSHDDKPHEQFATLKKSIPGLQATQCRKVVSLLNEGGKGRRTCSTASAQHDITHPLLQEVAHKSSSDDKDITMHMLSVPGMVQSKADSDPLYRMLLQKALRENQNQLTLIYYADEVSAGNILAPKHPRKAQLSYCTFLEMDVVHLETMWVTLSVVLQSEAVGCVHGYCSVVRAQLENIRNETRNGFALCLDGDCTMVFLKRALLLGDHEHFRSCSGAKGAAGLKPCLKCENVLSLGREARDHVDIAESDTSKMEEQSQNGLSAIQNLLESCITKKDLAEKETMCGWNLSALQNSFLNSPELSSWANIVYFDVMHQYWSCGMIACELGLWYKALHNVHVTLDHILTWARLGWKTVDGSRRPAALFHAKLWRVDADFRGDASACADALPLCVAFGEEMLRTNYRQLQPELDSLAALYSVVLKIQEAKANVSRVDNLQQIQRRHMQKYIAAYSKDAVRPKMHFALHTEGQARRWSRLLDAFVCERKHRTYKSSCGCNYKRLQSFSRDVLLHLGMQDQLASQAEERYMGQLVGKRFADPVTAETVGLSPHSEFAKGIEIKCIKYMAGTFCLINSKLAVQIHAGVRCASTQKLWLLVEALQQFEGADSALNLWCRTFRRERVLLCVTTAHVQIAKLVRETEDHACLLL